MDKNISDLMTMVEEMGGEEYESISESTSPMVHAAAGSAAGICEHTFAFPLDVVKTRLHRLRPAKGATYAGVSDAFRTMYRTEGARSLVKGFSAVLIGAGPAHAIYFASYEQAKLSLGIANNAAEHPYRTALAGVVATFSHEATMNPIEVVKQRMQMHNSKYTSPLKCLTSVVREEGIVALYRSLPTQVIMSVPYQCIHLVTYEFLRAKLNPTKEYNPSSHLIAGAGAGTAAALCTNPLDVTKTLLNTQEPVFEKQKMSGLYPAVRTIYQAAGLQGFMKGALARVGLAAPGTAISWGVYEMFKHFLGHTHLDSETKCC